MTLIDTGGAKVALPGGISGNTLATLDHGAGGNDVLSYLHDFSGQPHAESYPVLMARPVCPAISWLGCPLDSLYRQHLFDDSQPSQVSEDAGAFAVDTNFMTVAR